MIKTEATTTVGKMYEDDCSAHDETTLYSYFHFIIKSFISWVSQKTIENPLNFRNSDNENFYLIKKIIFFCLVVIL